jgi:hypothetical protein
VTGEDGRDGGVAAYKTILRDVLDRRPAGTRQRLAGALGTNRSFISQITNPAYPVPIPPQHMPLLLDTIHLSASERTAFMAAYERAHPGRLSGGAQRQAVRTIAIDVPDLGDAARNAAFDGMVKDLIARLARFAEGEAGRNGEDER